MDDAAALKVAIDLLHAPWRVRLLRKDFLPDGVPLLLRIAAGDGRAEAEAVRLADRPLEVIRQAAAFFIEQILLCPDADSYRVLGASPDAEASDLKRNMALLMSWVHPDKDPQGGRSIFAARVAMAWNDLKTPERRAAYDRSQASLLQSRSKEPRRQQRKKIQPERHLIRMARHPSYVTPPESRFYSLLERLLRRRRY